MDFPILKFNKGLAANIPTTYKEDTAYIATDTKRLYLDTTNTSAGRIQLNAYAAERLLTARTLTIGNTGKSFNGTANVAWSLNEIGAAPTNHASTATTYGVGTTANYGHVKVTNGNGLTISSGTIAMALATTSAAGAMSAIDKANVTYFVAGTQTAKTNQWTGTLSSISAPYDGLTIRYYLPYAGTSTAATLALNGGTAYPIYRYGRTTGITTHFAAGSVITMTFRSSYSVSGTVYTNAWIVDAYYDSTYYMQCVNCTTAAGTAAKTGSTSRYTLANNRHFICMIYYSNTYQGAITLNINSQGAKPIYINGSASSSTNYTLPLGIYLVYYDGANYYFRTDGKITGDVVGNATSATKATQDGSGNTITSTYLKLSGGTMTGQIKKAGVSTGWINGRTGAMIRMSSISGYSPFASIKTTNGSWEIGAYDNSSYYDDLIFTYCTDTNFNAGTNSSTAQIRFYENGTSNLSITGNAATATKFASAQSIALTGDVTGSASSQAGWSIATTLANSGVTAGSYGPTANVTGTEGQTISVPQITVDAKGRVTSVVNRTYTSKYRTYSAATSSAAGLMSATDKAKLDGITASADAVSFAQSLTSGTAVGTITINGTATTLYAPTNTDTKNSAGSTNTSSKIYLIGATSQAANPTTYSHDTVYVNANGSLTTPSVVLTVRASSYTSSTAGEVWIST